MNVEVLIEKYFEEGLTAEEQTQLDSLLANDAEASANFEFAKSSKAAFHLQERNSLKEKLQQLENISDTGKVRKLNYKTILSVAAVIILAVSAVFIFRNTKPDNEKLYADTFIPYPNVVAPATRGNEREELVANAFNAYESKNYGDAVLFFEVIFTKLNEHYALLYKGISLMELGKTEEGLNALQQEQLIRDSKYAAAANWYATLCLIKLNKSKEAITLLEKLQTGNNEFSASAKTLLEKLR